MANEPKREVWVVESDDGYVQMVSALKGSAKRECTEAAGERLVRYVPAAADQAGKAELLLAAEEAARDALKAASASGKAQTEWHRVPKLPLVEGQECDLLSIAERVAEQRLTELQGLYAAFEGSGHSPKNPREAAQAIGQMHDAEAELAAERARVRELQGLVEDGLLLADTVDIALLDNSAQAAAGRLYTYRKLQRWGIASPPAASVATAEPLRLPCATCESPECPRSILGPDTYCDGYKRQTAEQAASAAVEQPERMLGPTEALRREIVLALREAYAQNKGLWFVADELEQMGKNCSEGLK